MRFSLPQQHSEMEAGQAHMPGPSHTIWSSGPPEPKNQFYNTCLNNSSRPTGLWAFKGVYLAAMLFQQPKRSCEITERFALQARQCFTNDA